MQLLLYEFGFGDIWINPYSVTPVRFINAFKQRLVDNFVQKWKSDLDVNSTRDIEDEYHFVCVCPAYSDLRYKHIEIYYYNPRSMYNFCNLLQTREKNHLVNFAKFLYEAFERRKTLST